MEEEKTHLEAAKGYLGDAGYALRDAGKYARNMVEGKPPHSVGGDYQPTSNLDGLGRKLRFSARLASIAVGSAVNPDPGAYPDAWIVKNNPINLLKSAEEKSQAGKGQSPSDRNVPRDKDNPMNFFKSSQEVPQTDKNKALAAAAREVKAQEQAKDRDHDGRER